MLHNHMNAQYIQQLLVTTQQYGYTMHTFFYITAWIHNTTWHFITQYYPCTISRNMLFKKSNRNDAVYHVTRYYTTVLIHNSTSQVIKQPWWCNIPRDTILHNSMETKYHVTRYSINGANFTPIINTCLVVVRESTILRN